MSVEYRQRTDQELEELRERVLGILDLGAQNPQIMRDILHKVELEQVRRRDEAEAQERKE